MRRFNFHHRQLPGLNTTSTADISFMLLVFFLVTTSLNIDKGVTRKMPPIADEQQTAPIDINKERVLNITIDANNKMHCDNSEITLPALREKVMTFIAAKPQQHVIAISTDRKTSYEAYFLLQHEIVMAYKEVRDSYARKKYGHTLDNCSIEEQKEVLNHYPQRIADATGNKEGGAQ